MPWAPKRACTRHRRLNCDAPECQPRPRTRTSSTSTRRPQYGSSLERRRRERFVSEWLELHGRKCASGDIIARCPDCREMRARFVADHVTPIAEGGSEGGQLRIQCSVCSGKQGARLAARRARKP